MFKEIGERMKLRNKNTGEIVDIDTFKIETPLYKTEIESLEELKFRAWLVPYRPSDGKPSKRNKPYYDYFDLWNEYGDDTWFDGASVECFEQYTGLKDKNGKEIYEGDIVVNTYYDDGEMYKVLWVDDSVAFGMESLDDMELYKLPLESLEIIGNIHENPELIKGKKCVTKKMSEYLFIILLIIFCLTCFILGDYINYKSK